MFLVVFVFRDKWDRNHVRMPCSTENLYPGEVIIFLNVWSETTNKNILCLTKEVLYMRKRMKENLFGIFQWALKYYSQNRSSAPPKILLMN